MGPKDFFSNHSKIYAAFRPVYPPELYGFIFQHVREKKAAWDCGTGNGQVAHYLARHFEKVYATDISQQQLDEAIIAPNIFYSVARAEETAFAAHQFDLITVAQALHWFDFDRFYKEVLRTGKPGSIIAVWGYSLLRVNDDVDRVVMKFYNEVVGKYWDYSRRLVETGYASVPFPFENISSPDFRIVVKWTPEQLEGYINSWSAIQNFIRVEGYNPVGDLMKTMRAHWGDREIKTVSFPLFLKLGRIPV
jgi:ubiquinone/menaquinone biosynthesis C-methylase UbiE